MSFHPYPDHPDQTLAWLLDTEVIIQLHAWSGEDALVEIADALVCSPALTTTVVFDAPVTLDAVAILRERTDGHMLVGMSNVASPQDVREAAAAGARFVITPTFRADVWKEARDRELVCLPGVFSRAEVVEARAAGARAQFLFPAEILGPRHLHALHETHPDIHFFPGVNLPARALPAYRRAGAAAAVVDLPMVTTPEWRQADIISFVRGLVKAWRGKDATLQFAEAVDAGEAVGIGDLGHLDIDEMSLDIDNDLKPQ
ncbi:MAG TPA: hypothetical protein ENK60_02055 [Anaerolineae bacterium]|nr:hypothetical protein [Anaerolineae bacterium]